MHTPTDFIILGNRGYDPRGKVEHKNPFPFPPHLILPIPNYRALNRFILRLVFEFIFLTFLFLSFLCCCIVVCLLFFNSSLLFLFCDFFDYIFIIYIE